MIRVHHSLIEVASTAWFDIFPKMVVLHLDCYGSDHQMLKLELFKKMVVQFNESYYNFKFEPFWRFNPEFKDVIANYWNESNPNLIQNSFDLQKVFISCGHKLRLWGKAKFGNLSQKISLLQIYISELNNQNPSQESRAELHDKKYHLNQLLDLQEHYWHQRARVDWLARDRNTSYFHRRANRRKQKNYIWGIFLLIINGFLNQKRCLI